MAPSYRGSFGLTGEDLACRELRRRGYAVLARRYRTRAGEIDIVARDGPTLVFVEVKARAGERFGTPAEAVTPLKRRRLAAMAADYLARHAGPDRPCRFDIVTIVLTPAGRPVVEVIPDAFDVGT